MSEMVEMDSEKIGALKFISVKISQGIINSHAGKETDF